jgi:hypothetical protein
VKNGTHRCAVPDCTAYVPPEMLMCRPHWRLVPRAIGREVTDAWRSLRAGAIGDRARYELARAAAVDAVAVLTEQERGR